MAFTQYFMPRFLVHALVLLPTVVAVAHHDGHQKDLGFPSCVSDCIEGSGCGTANVKCMCRASQGDFLAKVVVCMYQDCSQAISVNALLSPLELACDLLGTSIPDSAISSAEAAQSSIEHPKPTTVTVSETTTAKATSSGKTTYTATTKATTMVATSTYTSTSTSATETTEPSTSVQTSGGTTVTTTTTSAGSTTDVHLSVDTTQTSSDSVTTTTTAGPVDPTDSSPFASPINSGGATDRASLLGAVMGLAAVVAFGW